MRLLTQNLTEVEKAQSTKTAKEVFWLLLLQRGVVVRGLCRFGKKAWGNKSKDSKPFKKTTNGTFHPHTEFRFQFLFWGSSVGVPFQPKRLAVADFAAGSAPLR